MYIFSQYVPAEGPESDNALMLQIACSSFCVLLLTCFIMNLLWQITETYKQKLWFILLKMFMSHFIWFMR